VKRANQLVLIILLFSFSLPTFAQDTKEKKPDYGWKNEAVAILNFTQNQFDNWTQGGENSWSWQMDLNGKFVNDREKYNWATSTKLSYGKTKLGDATAKKAADEIKLESVFTYKMGIYVNPYVAVTGLTQFTDGYKYEADTSYKVSTFMDPGYFTQSVGMGIDINKNIKTRLGAALKETITDKFNKDVPKKETLTEFGAESVTDIKWQMLENILYTSKLEMFSNLKGLDDIDVNWDNLFVSKISDYITVSFNLKLMYDKNISTKRQIKQILAVGLSYTLL